MYTQGLEKDSSEGDIAVFDDEESTELVIDNEEEALTSFDTTMLVNVDGSVEGMQTELYDSGASRHMSPYQDHFENYVAITLKLITAADKRYF